MRYVWCRSVHSATSLRARARGEPVSEGAKRHSPTAARNGDETDGHYAAGGVAVRLERLPTSSPVSCICKASREVRRRRDAPQYGVTLVLLVRQRAHLHYHRLGGVCRRQAIPRQVNLHKRHAAHPDSVGTPCIGVEEVVSDTIRRHVAISRV